MPLIVAYNYKQDGFIVYSTNRAKAIAIPRVIETYHATAAKAMNAAGNATSKVKVPK